MSQCDTANGNIVIEERLRTKPWESCIRGTRNILFRLFNTLGQWQERAAQRRQLGMLDNRMLADIGVDRATAAMEASKPFWRS